MPNRTYRYEVWGMGQFPEDMLRYDRAKIVSRRLRMDTNVGRDRYIYLIEGETKPTVGRWESFMWHVKEDV